MQDGRPRAENGLPVVVESSLQEQKSALFEGGTRRQSLAIRKSEVGKGCGDLQHFPFPTGKRRKKERG